MNDHYLMNSRILTINFFIRFVLLYKYLAVCNKIYSHTFDF